MVNVDKIKNLAKEKGIKIKYICAQLGLSETYLSNVKNGKDRMTDERLEKIAEILNTTTAYLRDETDTPTRPESRTEREEREEREDLEAFRALLDTLTEDELQKVLSYAEFLARERERDG